MSCPNCETDLPSSTRFCPGCGSPGQVAVETRAMALGPDDPYPAENPPAGTARRRGRPRPDRHDDPAPTASTAVIAGAPEAPPGPSIGERLAPAADVARDGARRWLSRFGAAPVEVRIASVGAVITVLSFLFLPYAEGFGAGVELSGRLWWRPIAAIVAAVLIAAALSRSRPTAGTGDVPRHTDALLGAVVVAAAGVAEAGLLGLLAGDVARPRAGFYGMLLGLVVVLVAAVRAARRTLR